MIIGDAVARVITGTTTTDNNLTVNTNFKRENIISTMNTDTNVELNEVEI